MVGIAVVESGDAAIREIQCKNRDDVCKHVNDRLGNAWTDVEILNWIDYEILLSSNYMLRLVTPEGRWSTSRHAENKADRGDAASVASKRISVETFGIRRDWRSPSWLVQRPLDKDHETQTLHWGTLLEGAEDGWKNDPKKEQKLLQLAVRTSIPGCKLYAKSLPIDCARFLVNGVVI